MGTELIAQRLTGGETQFDNRGSGLYSSLGDFGDCLCTGAAVIGIPHLGIVFFLMYFLHMAVVECIANAASQMLVWLYNMAGTRDGRAG